jgi:tetratricopeptide (TPR) repeat protein
MNRTWSFRAAWLSWSLALVVGGATRASAGPFEDHMSQGRAALTQGTDLSDPSLLLKARGEFLAASAAADRPLARYYVALANWRAVPLLRSKKNVNAETQKKAERLAEEGVESCDRVLSADPKNAEALALKAGLQGLLIQLRPSEMFALGPATVVNLDNARKLAPENPRVWLLSAINTLYKPAFVGGGPDNALKEFEKAQSLFAVAGPPHDDSAPAWGACDAWLFAGVAQMKRKDFAAARDAFQKALAVNPSNTWVKSSLLPGAEKALAAAPEKTQ